LLTKKLVLTVNCAFTPNYITELSINRDVRSIVSSH